MNVLTKAFRFRKPIPSFASTSRLYASHTMGKDRFRKSGAKRQKTSTGSTRLEGSNEETLAFETKAFRNQFLGHDGHQFERPSSSQTSEGLPQPLTNVEVTIRELSSTGDGLGTSTRSETIYVVPFALPGDVINATVIRHLPEGYSLARYESVVTAGPKRDGSLAKCKYFTQCGGCQFQMLAYGDQLAHKKGIVEAAYRNFSSLAPEAVPTVNNTLGSPRQYGYRTKLTPHFDAPPKSVARKAKEAGRPVFDALPPIGFMRKGRRTTMDIEECPIGTESVRQGLTRERAFVRENLTSYKKGATILLRESTTRTPLHTAPNRRETSVSPKDNGDAYEEQKVCITDSNAIAKEYVDGFVFENKAGAFFQNNNSILPSFVQYIRSNILGPADGRESSISYLVDAYCGSGLFTVTLSSLFSASTGIDIDEHSIAAAKRNAQLNNVQNANFTAATASAIFNGMSMPADKTVVVIDPPRKGCDEEFLNQLLRFAPRRVVYVSCNVHTQARDVGFLVEGKKNARYGIESLQGFDFFPQTSHVEAVAILQRVDDSPEVVAEAKVPSHTDAEKC